MTEQTIHARDPVKRRPRGLRTRAALVAAARQVFESAGFPGARIVDIAAAAGVSTGSFYTYFATKEDALEAVYATLSDELLYPDARAQVGDEPVTLIEAANRAYLTAYRDNAWIIGIFEHVSMDNPRLHEARKAQGAVFVERNGRAIRSLQAAGLVDPQLDPDVSALALGGMVSRMAWWAFVADYAVDFDHLVDTVTRLWVNALGIQRADGASDDRTPTG